jgi:hypothetical protein
MLVHFFKSLKIILILVVITIIIIIEHVDYSSKLHPHVKINRDYTSPGKLRVGGGGAIPFQRVDQTRWAPLYIRNHCQILEIPVRSKILFSTGQGCRGWCYFS